MIERSSGRGSLVLDLRIDLDLPRPDLAGDMDCWRCRPSRSSPYSAADDSGLFPPRGLDTDRGMGRGPPRYDCDSSGDIQTTITNTKKKINQTQASYASLSPNVTI